MDVDLSEGGTLRKEKCYRATVTLLFAVIDLEFLRSWWM